LETEYLVDGAAPLTLKIGTASPQLAALHEAHRVASSAYVTACNPFSQVLDEVANVDRQASLKRELQARSLVFFNGVGQHPSNQWEGEASFLVLGLSLEAAKVLGGKHGQNGVVWSGLDAMPQLILLR